MIKIGMLFNKNSRIAVVTGGGHRLGRTILVSLVQQGFAVLMHYNSSETLASETMDFLKSISSEVYAFKGDLTDNTQIKKMWEYIDTLPHDLEILINSAAIMNPCDIQTVSYSEIDDTLALNLRAPLLCSQEAAKRMPEGGLIINISDIGARKNWLEYPIYSISKAGLEVLTRILAKALAPEIRVNAIAPGLVMPSEKLENRIWEKLIAKVPAKRVATDDEITSMIMYLLSNKYITGQVIDIDGGLSL
jgi:pteridine reductase